MPYYGPGTPWYDKRGAPTERIAREKARMAEDLEAGLSRTGSLAETATCPNCNIPICPHCSSRRQSSASTYTGRGGAGNYGVPADNWAQMDSAAEASFRSIRDSVNGDSSRNHGRGGLGNYAAAAMEGERRDKINDQWSDQRRGQLQLDIEKGVDEALAMPPRAKLPLSSPKDVKAPTYS